MGKLFITFDFFCPGAYQSGVAHPMVENPGADADAIFLVLQPALLKSGADATDTNTYFGFSGDGWSKQVDLRFIAGVDPTIDGFRAAIHQDGVLVPLPPETSLSLVYELKTGGHSTPIDRILPSLDPTKVTCPALSLPCDMWPSYAEANFAQPPVADYADIAKLAPDRRAPVARDIENWSVAAFLSILAAKNNNTALAAADDAVLTLLDPVAQWYDQGVRTDEELRAKLRAPAGAPLFGAMWTTLTAGRDQKLQSPPPRVLHDQDSLATDPVKLLDLGDPANKPTSSSYHRNFWRRMQEQAAAAAPSTSPDKYKTLHDTLTKFFVFGERLRWSTTLLDKDIFMVLKENAVRAKVLGWDAFGTNGYSLLGQVFRLPIRKGDAIDPNATLTMTVAGQTSIDLMPAVREVMGDLLAPHTLTAEIQGDADRPRGFFTFNPRAAEATKVALPQPYPDGVAGGLPDALAEVRAIPAALLDAMTPAARTSSHPAADSLREDAPQRLGLRSGDLFLLAALGNGIPALSIAARLRPVPASSPGASLFALDLPVAFHDDERAEIIDRFEKLTSADAAHQGEIWLPDASGNPTRWRLGGKVLSSRVDADGKLRAILADADGHLAKLVAAAPAPAQGTHLDGEQDGVSVELMLPSPADAPLFNRLLVDVIVSPAVPLCILNSTFTSQVNASTDRLLQRFESKLAPSPLTAAGPIELAFANFDKLRISLESADAGMTDRWESVDNPSLPPGKDAEIFLTYPDAVAPQLPDGYTPQGAPWLYAAPQQASRFNGYYVAHVFTQDSRANDVTARGDGTQTPAEQAARNKRAQNAAEALRYINYQTAGTPWSLRGYLEHQYSYRIAFDSHPIALPLTTVIAHPAQAIQGDSALNAKATENIPLMQWSFDGTTGAITLDFPTRYLALALGNSADVRPARLRSIYEPLADLLLAIDKGSASLTLQGWCFVATTASSPIGREDPDDGGDISSNMQRAFSASHALGATQTAGLKTARDLLEHPFSTFEEKVAALATAPSATWMSITLPVDPASWPGLGSLKPNEIATSVDLLRLGLSIARPEDHVLASDVGTTPGFPLDPDEEQVKAYPALAGQTYIGLAGAAAAELTAFVAPDDGTSDHPSPLRRKFAWVRVTPMTLATPGTTTSPEKVQDPRRFSRLLGETASFAVAPKEARSSVERVVDLYYVPLAFRPLRADPRVGDPATTLDFAEFLVRALDDMSAGRASPAGIALEPTTPDAAFADLERARDTVLPGVATRLADLVHWVHQDPTTGASGLLPFVHDTTKDAMDKGLRTALQRRMQDQPALFLTSQGFGFAWVAQAEWSNRLHSMQIRKNITEVGSTAGAARTDVDKFSFRSFFPAGRVNGLIDVLDDNRYDNEFEIAAHTYKPARKPFERDSATRDQVTAMGQVQARTGEDVIDTVHPFDDPSLDRPLLVDARPWNPNWVRPVDGKLLYLLPSRQFPMTPLTVAREGAQSASSRPSDLQLDLTAGAPDANKQLTKELSDPTASFVVALGSDTRLTATPLADVRGYCAAVTDPPLPGQPPRDPKEHVAPGWWAVDTYVSEHLFVVQDDGEDPNAPFSADKFEITSELGASPFANEPQVSPAPFVPQDEAGRWFQYLRLKNSKPDAAVAAPVAMKQATLIDDIAKWLNPTDPADSLLNFDDDPSPLTTPADTMVTAEFTVTSKPGAKPPEPATLRETSRNVPDRSVGTILLTELLKLETPANTGDRYLLRVLLLDDRWRYSRVRARIVRNARDVNKDDVPDINQAFRLVGNYSTWSSQQLVSGTIDFTTFRPKGMPPELTDLRPAITLDNFATTSGLLSYGNLIATALGASVVDKFGTKLPFWNTTPTDLTATGIVVQKRHDLHPRYAKTDLSGSARGTIDSRTGERPLQHLASNGASVDLTIDRGLVISPFHQIRITWSRAGTNVLTCTWPVFFKNSP
jgi:hypothetical protein